MTAVVEQRGLVPFVDLAYQGFGDDLETDVVGLRTLAARVPELLLALSCSKNFGLYRERTGALAVLAPNGGTAIAVATHQARLARRMYSMPPDHGAAVVARLLAEPALREDWQREVAAMVSRMKSLRALLAGKLEERLPGRDFGWLRRQRGMFSLLGLDAAGIARLRDEHHVYVPPDGRMNVAGISDGNVDYVAAARRPAARLTPTSRAVPLCYRISGPRPGPPQGGTGFRSGPVPGSYFGTSRRRRVGGSAEDLPEKSPPAGIFHLRRPPGRAQVRNGPRAHFLFSGFVRSKGCSGTR